MKNSNPFTPWWYYEMSKDGIKHPNCEVSNGALVVIVICFILSLIFLVVLLWLVFGILLHKPGLGDFFPLFQTTTMEDRFAIGLFFHPLHFARRRVVVRFTTY